MDILKRFKTVLYKKEGRVIATLPSDTILS